MAALFSYQSLSELKLKPYITLILNMGNEEMSFDIMLLSLMPKVTECGVKDLHVIKN